MQFLPYKLLLLTLCLAIGATHAINNIEVVALFKDKAMINIDEQQHLLKVGGPGVLGVKLISATSKYAELEIDGKRNKYTLGNRVKASYQKQVKKKVLIYKDSYGVFKTTGSINGYTVDFIVDTGATSIAINSETARRLGLEYKLKGEDTFVSTASGTEHAYSMNLDRVKVGDIVLRNINAVILEGSNPTKPLLGMSFLGRLKMINEGQVLSLEEKY